MTSNTATACLIDDAAVVVDQPTNRWLTKQAADKFHSSFKLCCVVVVVAVQPPATAVGGVVEGFCYVKCW